MRLNGSVVHGGSFSLQLDPNPPPVNSGFSLFSLSFPVTAQGECPSASDGVNRDGKTLSGWIYLVNPPAGSTVTVAAFSNQVGNVVVATVPAVNGWFSFSGTTTNLGVANYISATITNHSGQAGYSESIYIDALAWR